MDCSEVKVCLYGREIHFDACVNLMDDDIREDLHNTLAPCDPQVFLDAYCMAHTRKYHEFFIVN